MSLHRRKNRRLGLQQIEFLEARLTFDAGSVPDAFVSNGTDVFFSATSATLGRQVWETNGTSIGTQPITALGPSGVGIAPQSLTVLNNLLFFTANAGTATGRQLWVTDLQNQTTSQITGINATGNANPENLIVYNDVLYFTANDGVHGTQLWDYNPSTAAPEMVDLINPTGSASPEDLTLSNNILYFSANDGVHGRELWSTNGVQTSMVSDINSGANGSNPSQLTDLSGTLYFVADDGIHGNELWDTNGINTGEVADIDQGAIGSNPGDLTVFNGELYFSANDGTHGQQLWATNGTFTQMVGVSVGDTVPDELTPDGNTLYFSALNSSGVRELWSTAGSAATTGLVDAGAFTNPLFLTVSTQGTLFFSAANSSGTELWVTDGTTVTTEAVSASVTPSEITAALNEVFFSAANATDGRELWTSDGLPKDTAELVNINTASGTVNTAPILNNDTALQLTTIIANDTSNPGTTVPALLATGAIGNPIYDPDTGAAAGIAVVSADNTDGTWQYTTNGGGSWTALGSPTETSAVLLASNAQTAIRFVPNANYGGDVSDGIMFRAWDQTTGTNGGTADTSTNAGTSAFSSAIATAGIRITPAGSDPWRNQLLPADVNGDGAVTPVDAIILINSLNASGSRVLPAPTATNHPEPFYDVNGDNAITPNDAVEVINYLNTQAKTAAVAQPAAVFTSSPVTSAAAPSTQVAMAAAAAPAVDAAFAAWSAALDGNPASAATTGSAASTPGQTVPWAARRFID